MARRVTFLMECEVRLERGDTGRIPRATKVYPAGWSGLVPEHHYAAALAKGAVDDNAGTGQAAQEAGGDSGQAAQGDAGRA